MSARAQLPRPTTQELRVPAPAPDLVAWVVVVVGGLALLARPWTFHAIADPAAGLVLLFAALGLVGAFWPLSGATEATSPLRPLTVAVIGFAAFAVGRGLAGPPVAAGYGLAVMTPFLLHGLAAVSEEAFFRRFLYGLLEPHGSTVAVWGSAAAFAAVHVTVWGWWVLPLDLAAGLLLSWQRAASGRWTVPAVTHVAANLWALA